MAKEMFHLYTLDGQRNVSFINSWWPKKRFFYKPYFCHALLYPVDPKGYNNNVNLFFSQFWGYWRKKLSNLCFFLQDLSPSKFKVFAGIYLSFLISTWTMQFLRRTDVANVMQSMLRNFFICIFAFRMSVKLSMLDAIQTFSKIYETYIDIWFMYI